jgi:hypothetical protein
MAKYTLLEIVSDILSDMDGDAVNSINDNDEASQVAQIVRTTYQALMSNRNWPHTARLISLTPFTDNLLPTHMRMEDGVKELISVYYDTRRESDHRINYTQIKYLGPDAFLRLTNQRNSTDVNCSLITDPSGIKFLIMSNRAPMYFTSFDDTTMVFDAYDAGIDSTLQASKVQARAYTIPPFEMSDDFIPDLPDEAFALLIEESKSKAMFKLKQTQDVKAEQEASRQNRWLSQKSWRAHANDIYPFNYGRNRGGLKKDPTFRRDY